MLPIVQKPISEPVIDRTGAVNYSACNNIDPLVSLDMVREFYDMQAKSLRTILDEIYNSIAGINAGTERFQSDIDRTNNSYTLFQRTVNAQIDNIKHTIDNAQNQTTLQLTSFSDRIDYIEKQCDSMRAAMLDHKQSIDDIIETLNKNVTACRREVDKVLEQFEDQSKAIQAVESANISNEERINGILNHIIPNLSKEMEYHDGQIIKMIKDITDKSKSTNDDLQGQITTAQKGVDDFKTALNEEKIRAQGEEIKLQDLIQGIGNTTMESNRQLGERVDDHDVSIAREGDRISREMERASATEDNLRTQIMAEASRATAEEASIKTDLKSITDLIGGKLDDARGVLGEMIEDETDERKKADEAIRTEYDDQLEKLHSKIESVSTTLTRAIVDGDELEKSERVDKDVALENQIGDIIKKVKSETVGFTEAMAAEIERSKAVEADFNDRLTRAHKDQLQTNGQNNVKFSEILKEVHELHRQLDRFMESTSQANDALEKQMKQTNATIITRIENLDNRVDSEINRAREAERRLQRRLDIMEGIPADDEIEGISIDDESDSLDKTDQGLMISDTDKEDN